MRFFLRRLIRACEAAKSLGYPPFADAFHSLSESLQACMRLNRGRLDRHTLLRHLSQLRPNTVLICHVLEQNAAVLIRRENSHDEQFVVVESFETSPTTESVLAADNALEWDFPGRAVRLSLGEFNDEKLQKNLSVFLERASMEAIHDLKAKANKANVSVAEIRDTSDPALIAEMLMSILEAIGEFAHVPKLRKRVRDDVNFVTGSLPWRRLPFWLVLRVAAQRHLDLSLGEPGRACYKLLMAVFFSELLHNATNGLISLNAQNGSDKNSELDPSLIMTLRTKLCRRMVKLEQERYNFMQHRENFERFFNDLAPKIRVSIEFSNDRVEKLWNDFKRKSIRRIEKLPPRASDKSLQLSLEKSGSYLEQVLKSHKLRPTSSKDGSVQLPDPLDAPVQEVRAFTKKIFSLAEMEHKFELGNLLNRPNTGDAENICLMLAKDIYMVIHRIGKMYDSDPALQSIKILTIFELWMRMDTCALISCPLLGEYRPVFVPSLLDALQLPSLSDMKRLLVVQTYLANRHAKAQRDHIFSALQKDSFSVDWFADRQRDTRGCTRCWHWRERNRIRIQHHEDFLPKDEAKSHMIVFELQIPEHLSEYRDATWKILRDLAYPSRPSTTSPYTTLDTCPYLQGFAMVPRGWISLASDKKCFDETHYSYSDGFVPLENILLPFAANFQLYDHEAKIWVKNLSKAPTLHHLCGINVPLGLSSTVLRPQEHPATSVDGPSSYEIQANTTKCPPSMSVAEFSAYQKLLAGKSRRWINILVELGSSNLNFSSEDTTLLLSQLAIQAGPSSQKGSGPLRDVHSIFKERDLRGFSLLSDDDMRAEFEQLLRKDADRIATYGLKASLLCRRTFEIHLGSQTGLSATDLSTWIRASVALQENRAMTVNNLPTLIRSMMIRDAKMMFCIDGLIRASVQTHPDAIGDAIAETTDIKWHGATGNETQPTASWTFLKPPHSQWIRYPSVRSLFGDHNLHVYASSMAGMEYTLAYLFQNKRVHFGVRDSGAIIRTEGPDGLFEFVPKESFGTSGTRNFELPMSLVDACTHWLNLDTGILEIRRQPSIWIRRPRDWVIDVDKRRATRGGTANIDVDQDAGTWYGLASKIVLRDATDKNPLTGVTGTEEAVRILQSGAAQPWSPLSFPDLREFTSLLPQRQYYPPELKRLQRVKWDTHLTTTIQSDRFETLIREIESKAGNLAQFLQTSNVQKKKYVAEEASQLRLRAQARRSLYERTTEDTANLSQSNQVYIPRDRQSTSRGNQVYQVAQMIHLNSLHINMARTLKENLEGLAHIGGFNEDISLIGSESLAIQMASHIGDRWGSLIKFCCSEKDKPSLIFQLGLLAFQPKANMDIVLSLVAFSCIKQLRELGYPKHMGYERFGDRGPPPQEFLEQRIYRAWQECPQTNAKCFQRQEELRGHREKCEEQGKLFAQKILAQWPILLNSVNSDTSLIHVPAALDEIRPDWDRRIRNGQLEVYVDQVDNILSAYRRECGGRKYPNEPQPWEENISDFSSFEYRDIIPSISLDLVTRIGPELAWIKSHVPIRSTDVEAQRILDAFSKSPNTLRQDYSSDLQRSLTALQCTGQTVLATSTQPLPRDEEITHQIEQLRGTIETYQKSIQDAFWSGDARFVWLTLGDMLPCRTPIEILCLLQSRADHQFEIQRLIRLRSAVRRNDQRAMNEELHNVGHENWNPMDEDTDWLLLEIDSNILIRTDQIDVARAVINPSSGQNSVLQMNMGRGKTSCIMPMAAAMLANGDNVSRLIVPKSLIMQTANMMHSRLDDKTKPATTMIYFQNWLDTHCRDILDECEFTLSPRTQLNYPSGSEKPFDGHPFRWQVAEGLLAMVAEYIPRLRESFPGSIELLASSSWFPAVQFLRSDVEDELHRLIVDEISKGKAPFLYINHAIDKETQTTIKRALCDQSFDTTLFEKAAGFFPQPNNAAKKLLIIRGYGLHPDRVPLAVPFAAKGVPSELSEYGHPDVTILLTCLSFYSGGLSYEQFRQGLQSMLASEDAASEYEKWISECNIPPHLQHWNLINMENEAQIKFVFQPHARQFTIKLQASAWDIPQNSGEEAARAARTTGFSGTNDNKYLMPMNIEQEDLSSLLQTNAEVLSYLLQPRNRRYSVLVDRNLRRLSEHDMLRKIHDQNIKILIDSGAYILEMGNREVAQLWLQVDRLAQAAVYFHSDNRAWVVYRDPAKRDTQLLATRLANNLENCLVYFDEAHTRGVDLKLPENAHAALTLALKQTKDNTMQAAMRLRQLRTTQSVAFFAPPEVDMSIRDICRNRLAIDTQIESPHVIFWLLEQTCRANEDLQPLFQAQGNDFCQRSNALLKYPNFLDSEDSKRELLKILQQPEHQTLMQMYGDTSRSSTSQGLENMLSSRLQDITNRLSQYDISGVCQTDVFGEVEQEREIEVQLETQREVQRRVHYQAHVFSGLSAAILDFFKTGKLDAADEEVQHAFDYIGETEVGEKHEIHDTHSRLFVSDEFRHTIELPSDDFSVRDGFLRPVEWVLWSPSTLTALVIIPEEAELLIPKLRLARNKAQVHLIAYAAPITRAMVPFNNFRYYSLPPIPLGATFPTWLKVELGILSGRLYTDYEEWKLICGYFKASPRGNISRGFLLEWLGLCCRAHDVLHTPMGYICLDRMATENHPFFVQNAAVVTPTIPAVQVEDAVEEIEDEKWEEEDSDDEDGSIYVDETKDGSVEEHDIDEEEDSSEENDSDEEDDSGEEDDSDEGDDSEEEDVSDEEDISTEEDVKDDKNDSGEKKYSGEEIEW
ncbi:hypothetical protein THAR02_02384 [Trichoderma harzianum]|uniref:ubiquitinyl hydrolase 1 n=1 Tax=Trichoderma harzianum TaxID=5544 RepID=A0A0F9ZZW4_TRIHA|nr:hypothetical protein THAR02_02384 [Trichoderma harzianum]